MLHTSASVIRGHGRRRPREDPAPAPSRGTQAGRDEIRSIGPQRAQSGGEEDPQYFSFGDHAGITPKTERDFPVMAGVCSDTSDFHAQRAPPAAPKMLALPWILAPPAPVPARPAPRLVPPPVPLRPLPRLPQNARQ